jgi:hypothetical protein
MAVTPEILKPGAEIKEKAEEFIVPETLLQATGIKVVQKNFNAQVKSDKGVPMIQTPPAQVINVSPPANQTTLTGWSKGPITASISWLGMFWLRIIKKAVFFGWKIVSGSPTQN